MAAVRSAVLATFVVVTLLAAGEARAQTKPTSLTTEYSRYEQETIRRALAATGTELDTEPNDKTIEQIEVVRLEVIEDRDVSFLGSFGETSRGLANKLHYVTRESIIRREMLIDVGDRWEQVTVDEIARNIRGRMPLQVSIVMIVPVKGSAPDKVTALVITKDIWSLRLSYALSVTPGGLEDFLLVPQETNLLGYQHTVSTRFRYQPESYTLGVGYSIPRFGRTWIGASASANVFINRRTSEPEGSSMAISAGQGLYSTKTEWAWSSSVGYSVGVARLYTNAHLAQFNPTPATRTTPDPDPTDNIPVQYRSSSVTASAGVTRSFGWALKNNFGLTMNASRSSVRGIDLDNRDPAAVAAFRARFLPVGEDRVYPALAWATFRNDYLRTLDIDTLALQEDYRLGHNVSSSVYLVTKALGSTRDIAGITGSASYSIAVGDGLVGAGVSTVAENDLSLGTITDGNVGGSFGAVTPRIGIGRIAMNTSFTNRYKNYLNGQTTTGGNDRIRGYPSAFFIGKDSYFYNIELRSTSVRVLFAELGAVAFYDAGDAANGFDHLSPKQSVGFGLRGLFPQVNRLLLRADLAFPLKRGPFPEAITQTVVDPVGFNITLGQAFSP
jgi:outer membrane protein assembly factor BamA